MTRRRRFGLTRDELARGVLAANAEAPENEYDDHSAYSDGRLLVRRREAAFPWDSLVDKAARRLFEDAHIGYAPQPCALCGSVTDALRVDDAAAAGFPYFRVVCQDRAACWRRIEDRDACEDRAQRWNTAVYGA